MTAVRTLTILATTGSELIRSSIEGWAAMGLMRRSVWLDPATLDGLPANVMSMPVQQVGPDGNLELALREVFGDVQYHLVRVVAVRQILDDHAGDDLTYRMWTFADRLRAALAQTTDMVRINVVIPNQEPVTAKGLLEPNCEVNVVVSPENRPREGAADHGFETAEEFDVHSALAVATVGALWHQTETGAFDQQGGQGTRGEIVVVRSAARALDARPLPAEIVDRVLDEGVASLSHYLPSDTPRAANDEALIGLAVEAFLPVESRVLYYREPERVLPPSPPPVLRMTWTMLLRFFAQMTRRKLLEWKLAAHTELDPEAEKWLLGFLGGSRLPPSAAELVDCATEAPVTLWERPIEPDRAPPEVFVWAPLRQLCFSLADGGELPEMVPENWRGLTTKVSNPTWIAASPDEQFAVPDDARRCLEREKLPTHNVRPGDHNAADRLRRRLRMATGAVVADKVRPEDERENDLAALQRCQEQLDSWRREGKWEKSLVGQLARHLDQQMRVADGELTRRSAAYQKEDEDRKRILAHLNQIQNRLWLHTGLVLLLAVVAASWFVAAASRWSDVMLWLAMFTSVIAVGWLFWLLWLAGFAATLESRLQEVEARRRATVAAVKRWPSEAVRLGSLYEILLDWGEIIGWMLHRPFGPRAVGAGQATGAEPARPQAFRLGRFAGADEQIEDLARLAVRDAFAAGWLGSLYRAVDRQLFPERADDLTAADAHNDPDASPAPPRYRREESAATGEQEGTGATGVPVRTQDASDDDRVTEGDHGYRSRRAAEHARERLLQSFRAMDGAGDIARSQATATIRAALLNLPPAQLLTRLSVTERSGNTVPAETFLHGVIPCPTAGAPCLTLAPMLFSDLGRVRGRDTVSRVHLWGTLDQPLMQALDIPEHNGIGRWNGPTADDEDHQFHFSMVRIDVSETCEEVDLAFPQ